MHSTTINPVLSLAAARPLPRPRLAVVIVNYNGWDDVARLVAALAESPQVQAGLCDVVVVDNDSDDPIPLELLELPPGVRLIVRPENGGFSAGVNAGWRATQSPWLLVLNPDVVPGPGLLGQVLARLERVSGDAPAPGIVGFGLRNPDGSRQPSVGAFPSLARTVWEQLIPRSRRKYQAGWRVEAGPVAWVTGACVLLNTRMLEDLGGMDEDFFLYYEEVALCRTARERGWRVEFDPSIEVVHLHPLQNRRVSAKLRVITRHSKLLYFRKHLPRWQFAGLAWIVAAEARVRGWWARLGGGEARAWQAIGRLACAMRHGTAPRGSEVRVLAEAVTGTGRTASREVPRHRSTARRPGPLRMGRGPGWARRIQLRKDGTE